MKPTLACDIDGVVCEFFDAYDQWVKQMYGFEAKPCDRYDWYLQYPHGGRLWSAAHTVGVGEPLYATALPTPGAPEALAALSEDWNVKFVTYRPSFLRQTTEEWLLRHGMDFPVFFPEYKGSVVADLYLDDYPKTVRALREDGKAAWLFDREWNRTDVLPRAYGWPHVLDFTRQWVTAA